MKQVALITELERPQLSQSDSLLVAPLREHRITAVPVPWDAPDMNWAAYDALVLRSCWLYHRQVDRFRAWLEALAQAQTLVWNPVPVALWNMDKRYLHDLAQHGVSIPPTIWLEQGETADLHTLLRQNGWDTAVVKARVSASAYNIWQTSPITAREQQAQFATITTERGVMVQQFIPQIAQGEWSLIFFNDEYSHAALKKPAADHIFVQQRFGGVTAAATPPTYLVRQAAHVLQQAQQITGCDSLYGRVDVIDMAGELLLMELELLEPGLFLDLDAAAAGRFAAAIAALL